MERLKWYVVQPIVSLMCARLCTSTSRMAEDRAWRLKVRSCSCIGIVATCSQSAKRTSHSQEGNCCCSISLYAQHCISNSLFVCMWFYYYYVVSYRPRYRSYLSVCLSVYMSVCLSVCCLLSVFPQNCVSSLSSIQCVVVNYFNCKLCIVNYNCELYFNDR